MKQNYFTLDKYISIKKVIIINSLLYVEVNQANLAWSFYYIKYQGLIYFLDNLRFV